MARTPKAGAKTSRHPREILPWIVGGLGLTAFALALVVIAVDAFRHQSPADLSAVETGRRATAFGVLIDVEVANRGGEAAAGVRLTGRGAAPENEATVDLDYVAGHSEGQAVLAFSEDPGPVELRVEGWSTP